MIWIPPRRSLEPQMLPTVHPVPVRAVRQWLQLPNLIRSSPLVSSLNVPTQHHNQRLTPHRMRNEAGEISYGRTASSTCLPTDITSSTTQMLSMNLIETSTQNGRASTSVKSRTSRIAQIAWLLRWGGRTFIERSGATIVPDIVRSGSDKVKTCTRTLIKPNASLIPF
jgi:hypothetical protein